MGILYFTKQFCLCLLGSLVLVVCSCSTQKKLLSSFVPSNPVAPEQLLLGDPYILRTDGRYYLYGTTDSSEGFRSWSSEDLKHWEPLGFVYRKTETSYGSGRFWAPEVHYDPYTDNYVMVYSAKKDKTSPYRLCMARSDTPKSPFLDELTPYLPIEDWGQIDPHLFWDKTGTPYLFFNRVGILTPGSKNGTLHTAKPSAEIYAVALTKDLKTMVGVPTVCVRASQEWELSSDSTNYCNEGSFVFEFGGLYFMTYSANHYKSPKYGIGYATASHPLGPWKKSRNNPLLYTIKEKGLSGPGHNSFTRSPDGEDLLIVYHSHADPSKPGASRHLNIEKAFIDAEGNLHVKIAPERK